MYATLIQDCSATDADVCLMEWLGNYAIRATCARCSGAVGARTGCGGGSMLHRNSNRNYKQPPAYAASRGVFHYRNAVAS